MGEGTAPEVPKQFQRTVLSVCNSRELFSALNLVRGLQGCAPTHRLGQQGRLLALWADEGGKCIYV